MKWKLPFTPMIIQLDDVLVAKDSHLIHSQGAVMNLLLDHQVRVVLQKHVILACLSALQDQVHHPGTVEFFLNFCLCFPTLIIIIFTSSFFGLRNPLVLEDTQPWRVSFCRDSIIYSIYIQYMYIMLFPNDIIETNPRRDTSRLMDSILVPINITISLNLLI